MHNMAHSVHHSTPACPKHFSPHVSVFGSKHSTRNITAIYLQTNLIMHNMAHSILHSTPAYPLSTLPLHVILFSSSKFKGAGFAFTR